MENSDGLTGAQNAPDDATRRIKEAAGSVMDRTKEAAGEAAQRGKENVAASVQNAASSLRRAAEQTQEDNALIGKTLRAFADGLEKTSHNIEGADLRRSLQQINAFARKEPAIFLGASFALGFALARVGKAAVEATSNGGAGTQATLPPDYDAFGG